MFIPFGVLILILLIVMTIVGDAERSVRSAKKLNNLFDAPINNSSIVHRKEDDFYTPSYESEQDKVKREIRLKEEIVKINQLCNQLNQSISDLKKR